MSPLAPLGLFGFAGAAAAGDYESIATVTVGSGGSSTVTFSSIPQTYKHLQIRMLARGANADTQTTLRVQFNSDTGTNYSYHRLLGTGSSASATGGGNYNYIYLYSSMSGTSLSSNIFGAGIMDILDYSSSSINTTVRFLSGVDGNGSGLLALGSGGWFNTAAVSTITLTCDGGGNFQQYSHFALYGIKGA